MCNWCSKYVHASCLKYIGSNNSYMACISLFKLSTDVLYPKS
jgi:hypothetical protein